MNEAIKRQQLNDLGYWARALFIGILLSLCLGFGNVLYQGILHNIVGYKYWFEYKSVTPTKSHFGLGEKLAFTSRYKINRTSPIVWIDVLYCHCMPCKTDRFESSYKSYAYLQPTNDIVETVWAYNAALPRKPAICTLTSSITVTPRIGPHKTQIIVSEPFAVGAAFGDSKLSQCVVATQLGGKDEYSC